MLKINGMIISTNTLEKIDKIILTYTKKFKKLPKRIYLKKKTIFELTKHLTRTNNPKTNVVSYEGIDILQTVFWERCA